MMAVFQVWILQHPTHPCELIALACSGFSVPFPTLKFQSVETRVNTIYLTEQALKFSFLHA